MDMKSRVEAMRALAYYTAGQMDRAHGHEDALARQKAQTLVDLLIPVVKGWCTDNALGITSDGVQIHGGMGFIEETGASQHMRDARITTIYEGTTGIQANDLIGRKTARDGGATARLVAAQIDRVAAHLASHDGEGLNAIGLRLAAASAALESAIDWMVTTFGENTRAAYAGSVPYLKLWGLCVGGCQMGRAATIASDRLKAGEGNEPFLRAKIATARYYAECLLPEAEALSQAVVNGSTTVLTLPADQF